MILKRLRVLAGGIRNRQRFAVERALLAGSHRAATDHPSIIHFTLNRAGSQFVKSLLRRCSEEAGLTHADLTLYAYASSFPYLYDLPAGQFHKYAHAFRPRGYVYSAFNGFLDIPHLDEFRVLLVIRDPRDVLTSRYYSDAFGHPRPPETGDKHIGFDELRASVQATDINDYVLAATPELKHRYQQYLDHLAGRNYACVVRYEDMVTDFPRFLDRVLGFAGLTIGDELKNRLLSESAHATPETENVYRHVRKRLPGDHVQKLDAKTIARLNEEWSAILDAFGYPVEVRA
jgi:hypothetical protein